MRLFPHASLVIGLVLALATAAAFNWSWVAQHTITSKLPPLSVRHPRASLRLLFGHRRWLIAFLVGIVGWVFYVLALRLAPLSLVQSVSAGGLGLLAVFAQRASGEPLPRREWFGVGMAVLGLVFLSASLAGGTAHGRNGSWIAVGAWFAVSLAVAGLAIGPGASLLAPGAGFGLAAGLMYAAADVGTKAAVSGGTFLVLIAPVWACHGLAFTLIQLAFQRGTGARDRRPVVVLHERAPDRRRDRDLPRARAGRRARRAPDRRVRVRDRRRRLGRPARAARRRAGARSPAVADLRRVHPRRSTVTIAIPGLVGRRYHCTNLERSPPHDRCAGPPG